MRELSDLVYRERVESLRRPVWRGGSDHSSVSKAVDRARRLRTEERESALAVQRASDTEENGLG